MDIGTIIKQYRLDNQISMRDFAEKCGVSHSYIAMLEIRKNSKTGEPIVPTIAMLKKISSGLGITVNELIAKCDDMPISLSSGYNAKNNPPAEPKLTEGKRKLLEFANSVPEEKIDLVLRVMQSIVEAD